MVLGHDPAGLPTDSEAPRAASLESRAVRPALYPHFLLPLGAVDHSLDALPAAWTEARRRAVPGPSGTGAVDLHE
jgi:hypothetical protein